MANYANRLDLRRALLQLFGTTSVDQSFVEQGEGADEVLNTAVTHGIWNAQTWLVENAAPYFLATPLAITAWVDSGHGLYYVLTSANVLRLAGDRHTSALRTADGDMWGGEIPVDDRFRAHGAAYYVLEENNEERLWLARGASPPNPVYLHYHERHPVLSDDSGTGAAGLIRFPLMDRPLIVAEAAIWSKAQAWYTGDQIHEGRLYEYQRQCREQARKRLKRTRQPKRRRVRSGVGTHWFR